MNKKVDKLLNTLLTADDLREILYLCKAKKTPSLARAMSYLLPYIEHNTLEWDEAMDYLFKEQTCAHVFTCPKFKAEPFIFINPYMLFPNDMAEVLVARFGWTTEVFCLSGLYNFKDFCKALGGLHPELPFESEASFVNAWEDYQEVRSTGEMKTFYFKRDSTNSFFKIIFQP